MDWNLGVPSSTSHDDTKPFSSKVHSYFSMASKRDLEVSKDCADFIFLIAFR